MTGKIDVLSAGAIEPGLVDAAERFREETGYDVRITWATTPVIERRIDGGEIPDVVIATRATIDGFVRQKRMDAERAIYVGRVGIGLVVRDRAPAPDISTVGALKYALLDADSVVFNRASSGLQVERIFREMGVLQRILPKVSRYDNGPAVMEHLINGIGKEIGFGAIVEILMFRKRGLKLVAPLPPEVQHYTEYVAAPMTGASGAEGARRFVRDLDTPKARAGFAACGVE